MATDDQDGTAYRARTAQLQDLPARLYRLLDGDRLLSRGEGFELLRDSAGFRSFLTDLIVNAPWPVLRFETPAVTRERAAQPLEFALLGDPILAQRADPSAFAEHFSDAALPVAAFANLGGDGYMIAPTPPSRHADFAHLAAFLRASDSGQQHALWQCVGEAMLLRLNDQPLWLSTAGGGVPWLHVRIDTRPKYYAFRPYAVWP
jgi:hypothetical protein